MKKVILLTCSLIVISVTGCGGPSSEVLAVTMVSETDVAATQTRAAMPTSTPTETSTPLPTDTPIPTNTPTEVPATPTIEPQPAAYTTPGPPPAGLPEAVVSEYLRTNYGAFSLSIENLAINYIISLDVIKDLPPDAYIEAYFENPADPLNPILVTQEGPQPQSFELESPPLDAIERKTYWVEVIIYSSPDKETILGRHVQWIKFSL